MSIAKPAARRRVTGRVLTPWLYVLPLVLLMGTFVYIPMLQNFYYLFRKFSAFSPEQTFVGTENLKTLLTDPVIYSAIRNNIWYCLFSVLCQVFLSLICAALLEDRLFRRVATPFRTMYFLPVLISTTVIAMLFTQIYAPKGILNGLINLLGGNGKTGWLGRSESAIFCAIAMSQWHSMGYTMMLFIVAIQKIPEEMYEAAEIDGAGRVQRFFTVTLPQVREMIFVTMVTTVSGAFLVFNDVYILTKGGPGNASVTLSVYMYNMAFTQDRMGYASAIAILMLLICLTLAALQKVGLRSGEVD
ncbi:carbohydrate ABC transporter permease [Bacillota bacterium Meth-B3]|nr:sugar ABC transporter permease [Christensenellaceae bacterium]MEA5065602.1 sugar ABC transporter permease [Eubacteriales bacterium]